MKVLKPEGFDDETAFITFQAFLLWYAHFVANPLWYQFYFCFFTVYSPFAVYLQL